MQRPLVFSDACCASLVPFTFKTWTWGVPVPTALTVLEETLLPPRPDPSLPPSNPAPKRLRKKSFMDSDRPEPLPAILPSSRCPPRTSAGKVSSRTWLRRSTEATCSASLKTSRRRAPTASAARAACAPASASCIARPARCPSRAAHARSSPGAGAPGGSMPSPAPPAPPAPAAPPRPSDSRREVTPPGGEGAWGGGGGAWGGGGRGVGGRGGGVHGGRGRGRGGAGRWRRREWRWGGA